MSTTQSSHEKWGKSISRRPGRERGGTHNFSCLVEDVHTLPNSCYLPAVVHLGEIEKRCLQPASRSGYGPVCKYQCTFAASSNDQSLWAWGCVWIG